MDRDAQAQDERRRDHADVRPAGVGPPDPRVALPFFLRRLRASLPPRPGATPVVPFDPKALERNPAVTWIGHATFYVRLGGAAFLTDPMYSERASPLSFAGPRRLVPPGVPLDAIPRLDFALVSHDHYDHADLATLRRLAQRGLPFVVPLGIGELVRQAGGCVAAELGWWQEARIDGVTVTCVPARHFSGRAFTDRNRRLWAGFVVADGSRRLYHSGDTALFPGFAEIGRRAGPIDLACLPIGAYEPRAIMGPIHLNPEEAVRAAVDLGARGAVAMHFGTFDLSDEPLDEPPRRFLAEARARGLGERAVVIAIGETRPF
jgi:N-acyl-phosphatidylethanolamine-hydrolysing phospholipase D